MLDIRNDALAQNPPNAPEHITVRGSDWYWAVFAVMAFSALAFSVMATRTPRENRIFYYITIAILTTASIAYYTMASDLGVTPIQNEFFRSNPKVRGISRQIFYARYIDWVITTPLLLLDILLTAGLTWSQILYTVFVDLVMIVTGLFGALVPSRYKWGYFAFAMFALFLVAWQVVYVGFNNAKFLGNDVHKLYLVISWWTIFLWFLYPIAWGLSEGGNVISSDSEAVFYGILDIMAKPVFGAILLWGHRNIDHERLNLTGRNATPTAGMPDRDRNKESSGRTSAQGAPASNQV